MLRRTLFTAVPVVVVLVAARAPAAPNVAVAGRIGASGQGAGAPGEASRAEAQASKSACADGMVEVRGDYCAEVQQVCAKWQGKDGEKRDRCAAYGQSSRCLGATKAKHFCVDRFEYPNREGEKPEVAVTFDEAEAKCKAAGKRLCGAEEWTVACEGPDRLPYGTGYARDKSQCNYDKPYILPDDAKFANPETRDAEVARLDQREPSGARNTCVSAYGVHDMTGNVDEWVVNEAGSFNKAPYRTGLKGGYWGPVRNRCRPMTTDHNRYHSGYQIGFRCCADVTP
jgi:formylglycine-generating enzyme